MSCTEAQKMTADAILFERAASKLGPVLAASRHSRSNAWNEDTRIAETLLRDMAQELRAEAERLAASERPSPIAEVY